MKRPRFSHLGLLAIALTGCDAGGPQAITASPSGPAAVTPGAPSNSAPAPAVVNGRPGAKTAKSGPQPLPRPGA